MLKLYYDFLDGGFDRHDFELIQLNMDSNYIAFFADPPGEIFRPELGAEFEATKQQ